jgi:hypothetical protein
VNPLSKRIQTVTDVGWIATTNNVALKSSIAAVQRPNPG